MDDPRPQSPAATANARILLAEDDRVMRRACETALKRRGYEMLLAEDGEQALALARAERPDLILLDLLMPRMTGGEVLAALRADPATRTIPVVILSNSSREAERASTAALGVVDYVIKADLSLQALGDRVHVWLGAQP